MSSPALLMRPLVVGWREAIDTSAFPFGQTGSREIWKFFATSKIFVDLS